MAPNQLLRIETGEIHPFHVVTNVHVTDPLERSVRRPGHEIHDFTGPMVGPWACEESLMSRLVNEIGGEHHRMRAQPDTRQLEHQAVPSHEGKRAEPGRTGGKQRQEIREGSRSMCHGFLPYRVDLYTTGRCRNI